MKRLLLNTFLFALLSTVMVACSKEEVKPFSNGPAGNSASMQLRGEDDPVVNTGGTADPNQGADATSEEEVDVDGDGITDGGSSSDYDSKSSKKKKQN